MSGRLVKYCGDCRRGPWVETRANAISRPATLFVDAEPAARTLLWRRWRNHGRGPISAGKGQG